MTDHRYILEQYKGMKTRYTCPECNKPRKFARYIDTETNEQLGDKVGKCERSDNCAYHFTPKQHFAENGISPENTGSSSAARVPKPERPASLIDGNLLDRTLVDYGNNNFVTFLHSLFDQETVTRLIEKYKIGTSKHWPGSTVFWQIDVAGNIRTGKIMQYDATTGKRIKVPYERIQWVHKVTKAVDFNLKQCLFGEHLLFSSKLPVAVVEAEKTAIIASGYLPQFTWVASGNKQGLSVDKCNALKANSTMVILYPDLNAFKDWNEKAKLYKFKISDLLEKKATAEERDGGLDLADFLIRFDIELFTQHTPVDEKKEILPSTPIDVNPEIKRLHLMYTEAEENGKLDDHPQRSWISSMWQGVIMYHNKPEFLPYYIEQLKLIQI